MRNFITKLSAGTAVISLLASTPAAAHTNQVNVMEGLVHFMTEPDHIAVSAVIAAALIFVIRKTKTKRN